MVLKLKQTQSPPEFAWDASSDGDSQADSEIILNLPSPPMAWLSAQDMKMFGAEPLRNDVGIVKCAQCGKPILRSALSEHTANCAKIRALAPKNKPSIIPPSAASSLKRKASSEPLDQNGPPAKKQRAKPITKVTKGRSKLPVDLDRQCGVINDKGLQCSRSLTCKSHSMGAKRAVEGRTRKYDELLLDWNRAHNPNFQEPVKRETKKEKKEKRDREKAEQKAREREEMIKNGIDPDTKRPIGAPPPAKKKKAKKDPNATTSTASANNAAAARAAVGDGDPDAPEDWDALDSDVEFESVVKAYRAMVSRGEAAKPLARPCDAGTFFVARRERLRGCRDLVANALAGGGGSIAVAGVPKLA